MAGDASHQIWLTSVINDDDVGKALALCFSLKRVFSTRKVAVIVSSQVSTPLKHALYQGFDLLFYLEEYLNTSKLNEEQFSKLSALALKSFTKIVYLEPTMMAIKNSDEIFDEQIGDEEVAQIEFICPETGPLSIFAAHPSMEMFFSVMAGLSTKKGPEFNEYVRLWAKNQYGSGNGVLDGKFNRLISPQNVTILSNETCDVSIINVKDILVDADTSEFGLFAQLLLQQWKQIHNAAAEIRFVENSQLPRVISESRQMCTKEPIAIVGMACRYPSANNLEEFWNLLVNGEDGTGTAPDFRWLREHSTRQVADCRKTNAGFLKTSVENFDAKFFGISPKEMVFLDPQHRLLHELVWEGLEDAALNPHELRGTNGGVFVGSWTTDYKDLLSKAGNNEFYRMYMGNSIGAAAARISHLLELTGPSLATESGCSSAMVAVHLACKSLQRGEASMALACGVNLLLHPFDKDLMPMVVSQEGHSKTFDAKADGFARAEGCGVLVLKRLSDAVRDGDKVWALIRGSAMTQEGVSKSMGTPTVYCESLAMKQALRDAEIKPEMVSYVEAHGTGTIVGDPMEVAAIAKAYYSNKRCEPLLIGSVKTNVGHTESCSGITGIMKVVLALQHEIIPPHRNFETLNPDIDLDAIPAKIPLQPAEWWKQKGKPRFAGVSSFGITGTDAHAILEEAPTLPSNKLTVSSQLERPLHIMKLTAKTEEALELLVESFKNHFTTTESSMADLAYTANVGRANFNHRAVIIAKSNEDAIQIIEKNKEVRGEEAADGLGKVCFLFTGQGSQYPGMAKQLYETSPVFKMHFEYCEKILKNQYNIDITQVLWSKERSADVSRTIYSQTSIFCVEYALLKLWESFGVNADFALGHSLGEFAAAVCAGILTVEDAIKLVAERSQLIDLLPRGKMLVIKADRQRVDSLMTKFAGNEKNRLMDYAAVNSAEQTVVAGDSELILQFSEFCQQSNLKCIVLEATHAFHSKHMDPMLNDYRAVAETTMKMKGDSRCKYISGVRGCCVEAADVDADYWVEHTREKVLFMEASRKAVELGCKIFIEVGPQPVLSALTMMNNDTQLSCLPSLKRNESEWETLLNTIGKLYVKGLNIDWKGFEQFYLRKKVALPHYPFIGKKFWPDMVTLSGVPIHPLLGSVISNASSSRLFQSGLNLSSLEYVKDHAIGENVIFPGAGFLEMCLAAGLATVEGSNDSLPSPTRAMKVENLSIQAPLSLDESKSCQVQTVVDLNSCSENDGDWNDMKISIFRKMESDSTKWLAHAKATFSPLPTTQEKSVSFDIDAFTQTLNKPSNDDFIQEIYDKLASVGLTFGPNFRSLEKIWRDEGNRSLVAKVKVPSGENSCHSNHIIHPVVLDAMIQAIMMLRLTCNLKKKLHVPIQIGKFIWLSSPSENSTDTFIHSFEGKDSSSSDTALLLDSTGKVLASMSSVEFIETTVKAIDSVLEHQTSSMPDLWEEVWKPQLGPLEHRLDLLKAKESCSSLNIDSDDYNTPSPPLASLFRELESLVYYNMLRCLYSCGWEPRLHQTFDEDILHKQLKIEGSHRHYFGFMLEVLRIEGFLTKESDKDTKWKVTKLPPTLEETEAILSSPRFTTELTSNYNTTPLFRKVGENLSKIMTGGVPALNILFPEVNDGYPSVGDFYMTYENVFHIKECVLSKCTQKMAQIRKGNGAAKTVLRVLEIGAGTGSFSENALDALADTGTEFEYTYTDISAAFFPAAEKKFEKYAKSMKFRKLNIEEDPIDQGFIPEYYDHVCASDVIHATRDIKESLKNMRALMKPQAMLELQEMTGAHRFVFFLFGLLEGFWRFEDRELRPQYCTLTGDKWRSVLQSSGFEVEAVFPMLNNYHSYLWAVRTPDADKMQILEQKNRKSWLIFQTDEGLSKKVSNYVEERLGATTTRSAISVRAGSKFQVKTGPQLSFKVRKDVEEDFVALIEYLKAQQINLEGIVYTWAMEMRGSSQADILSPYFYLTKSLLSTGLSSPRIVVVTTGVVPVADCDMSNFGASTIMGYTKSLKNENHVMSLKLVDVEPALGCTQLEEIYSELWSTEKDVVLAYRGGTRFVAKLQAHKVTSSALSLPKGTDRFELVLPETKLISDLVFGPLDTTTLGENDVEIQVKASALNFRDVLSVIKPTEQFKNINAVGFDLAGVVNKVGEKVSKWKVGDLICGCNTHFTALPSHVNLHEDLLLQKPPHISFCDAATMPAVYMTSVLCLVDVAKIKKEDVVLIHTASGGVGLSAIQICKSVGCQIIATAGSKRKQTYLSSIGIQHIFHSRNTQYGDQILELTNGRGVDVVLNSLTSEGFKEATLKACAKGARFVEMSKLNIWEKEQVKELRPDVEYTVVDLSAAKQSEMMVLHGKLRKLIADGIMKPVPNVRFDALNIREALQYMQKAKHIGKVVCVMPEFKQEDGKVKVYTPMFNDSCTYMITGGLGGIGFEVCKWMIEKGAKNIILASRRPPSHSIQNKINEMNSKGANIIPVSLDVGNFDECEKLFQQIGDMKLPPLKGVMHAAGIIADALIQNMDWAKLSSTFHTKVNGTLNLHELSKSLDLEHFVVFSSMAALFGPPGQCNHAAANAFEDALIQFRNSIGLPGTTVNWGQWGQVGIATEVDLPGVKTLSNLQGLTGLEYTLKAQHPQLAIFNVSSFRMLSKLFPQLAVYLDESIWKSTNVATLTVRSEQFWENYDSKREAEEKVAVIKEQLKSILQAVLKLEESEDINEDGNFQEMGVDSLMFVEIKNALQALLGTRVTINVSALKDCNTINRLAETMFKVIEGESTDESLPPTAEAVKKLLREDSVLPERITAANCQREAVKVRDIRRVFLAGATGTLGPYMLKAFTNLPQISQVVCLMRASKNETKEERLRRFLSTREMLTEVDMNKVRCVSGNVVEANLGLETQVWEELSNSVDAIFNCSARVQHNEQYRKRNSKTDVRAVNIEGTKNLLQFACEKKLKHFYQASSLIAVVTTDELGRVSETWPNLGDYDDLTTFAYPISKYVGDVLTKEAVARGIPCKAFRFPLIAGESKTGRCAPENNHALLRYMFIMKHGMMPSTPIPLPILPVDVCAEVSLNIFFNEKAPSDVYNVGNAKVDVEQEFVKVAKKFGYDVSIVELSEFLQKVKESSERDSNSALSLFSEMYSDEGALMFSYTSAPVIQRWIEGNKGIYLSRKLPELVPDFYETQRNTTDYIYKDLLFVKAKGWFGKFGL